MPEVLKKKPEDMENYNQETIEDIDIYVHKGVKTTDKNELVLRVRGFLFLKEIYVDGLDLVLN